MCTSCGFGLGQEQEYLNTVVSLALSIDGKEEQAPQVERINEGKLL